MSPRGKEGLLASGDMLHLGLARWKKLHKDFYHKKKDAFDLSKIPDIYDCAKYDFLHSPGLTKLKSGHLVNILYLSKALADIVVPQEYGITVEDKFSIGQKIGRSLLRKIRSDIFQSVKASMASSPAVSARVLRRTSFRSVNDDVDEKSESNENETDETETVHRLDPELARAMGIKSSNRHVRTRMYFTSESHLHSLFNVLRFAGTLARGNKTKNVADVPLIMNSAMEPLSMTTELGYQTHIIVRLYEIMGGGSDKGELDFRSFEEDGPPQSYPKRFRISVSIGDGVMLDEIINENDKERIFEKLCHYDEPDFDLDHECDVSVNSIEKRNTENGKGDVNAGSAASIVMSAEVHGTGDEVNNKTTKVENQERDWVSSRTNIQLEPCHPMIPMWDNVEAAAFDRLLHYSLSSNTPS
uniref:Inositol hexakisphosphate and diphosphoinositol-pentakisphosphate kinase n=2 Tax=Aplanochytrium stocchinoi TaxID=215587 RepID=A0A7S3PGV9_9STRA|mmetsp:Transcript_20358/g.24713  ORF Transcript_20358/g.24713 Transcript_20358/m.24713 type:complete len:414 (-) Transcript_20358:162-1403(-)